MNILSTIITNLNDNDFNELLTGMSIGQADKALGKKVISLVMNGNVKELKETLEKEQPSIYAGADDKLVMAVKQNSLADVNAALKEIPVESHYHKMGRTASDEDLIQILSHPRVVEKSLKDNANKEDVLDNISAVRAASLENSQSNKPTI